MTSFILDLKFGVYFPCYLPHGNPPFKATILRQRKSAWQHDRTVRQLPLDESVIIAVSGTYSCITFVHTASLMKALLHFSPQFARLVRTGSFRLLHAVRR